MDKLLILVAVLLVGGAAGYYAVSKRKNGTIDLSGVPTETVDGVLHLKDIVAIFKQKSLIKGMHTPFIASEDPAFGKMFAPAGIMHKEGYNTAFIGVYNEKTETIEGYKIIYYKEADQELKSTLGNNHLVVLN